MAPASSSTHRQIVYDDCQILKLIHLFVLVILEILSTTFEFVWRRWRHIDDRRWKWTQNWNSVGRAFLFSCKSTAQPRMNDPFVRHFLRFGFPTSAHLGERERERDKRARKMDVADSEEKPSSQGVVCIVTSSPSPLRDEPWKQQNGMQCGCFDWRLNTTDSTRSILVDLFVSLFLSLLLSRSVGCSLFVLSLFLFSIGQAKAIRIEAECIEKRMNRAKTKAWKQPNVSCRSAFVRQFPVKKMSQLVFRTRSAVLPSAPQQFPKTFDNKIRFFLSLSTGRPPGRTTLAYDFPTLQFLIVDPKSYSSSVSRAFYCSSRHDQFYLTHIVTSSVFDSSTVSD